jgi:Cof subfamily protein (haloacid dehalogenase superfamily)
MTQARRAPAAKISAVVADIDGTLVTDDKVLTAPTEAAVAKLRQRGIPFCVVSSRPPRGLRALVERLGITTPLAGFNGGLVATPDLTPLTRHVLSPAAARQAVETIMAQGAQAWVFCDEDWLIRDPKGPYVDLEERTIGYGPIVMEDFGRTLDTAAKIVAVSDDFALLDTLEQRARAVLADQATVVRSQHYYVDFTHPLANKGEALSELAKLLAIPTAEIAVIGDGSNDVAMFERSGLSIAMGNASPAVQAAADFVTDANSQDGFAKAMDWFILGGNRANPPELATPRAAGERGRT